MIKNTVTHFMEKVNKVIHDGRKKRGGKEIIMEFAIGAIAIVLALVFREQLETVIKTVGGSFTEKITSLFSRL